MIAEVLMPTDAGHIPTPSAFTDPQPAATDPATTTLVVGHDGHPASQAALRCAVRLAIQLHADLHVLHSITLDDYGIDPDIEAFEEECQRSLAAEHQAIADAFSRTTISWSYHEERGDPASRLAQLAASVNAAMIIVGATQPGLIRHLINAGDSVPRRLLRVQGRPVLVVPATAPGP